MCQSIIESFHPTDLVLCKCGEISVDAGEALKCAAKDWSNFLRVDDEGNEIVVKVESKTNFEASEMEREAHKDSKPNRKDMMAMLQEIIKSYDGLPRQALDAPVTNADLLSTLLLLNEILKRD